MGLLSRGIAKPAAGGSRGRHDSVVLRNARALVAIASALSVSMIDVSRAEACGGFFSPPQATETTVVTDHRMAFSVSQSRTVLWDQIRYQGNPAEFVWALPVKPGTIVELSSDQWISALDAVSQPVISSPLRSGGDDQSSGPGFGCGAAVESANVEGLDNAGGAASVQVVSESVVGPYDSVILKSTDPKALENWLVANGYELPAAIAPVVNAYVNEGFDFLALRLRPGVGVGAMQPVRVITPGADPTLPLRMVQAGATGNIGLTLYVIGEGRYQPQNFPTATIDDSQIIWNDSLAQSNYQAVSTAAMAANGGSTFITEYAGNPGVILSDPYGPQNLAALYYGECQGNVPTGDVSANINDADGGTANSDGGAASCGDAGASDDDGGSAGACAKTPAPAPSSSSTPSSVYGTTSCSTLDDLVVAVGAMDANNVWVTRLRGNPPVSALTQDLVLEASNPQTSVSNQYTASSEVAGTTASISPRTRHQAGSILVAMFTAMLVVVRLRRRAKQA